MVPDLVHANMKVVSATPSIGLYLARKAVWELNMLRAASLVWGNTFFPSSQAPNRCDYKANWVTAASVRLLDPDFIVVGVASRTSILPCRNQSGMHDMTQIIVGFGPQRDMTS